MSAVCEDISDREINPWFRGLIVALTLNLSACDLKLDNLSEVIGLCSLILEVDAKNVKALFRRGLACMNLGNLHVAYDDLKQAKNLEPKNKDIIREFSSLERVMLEVHEDNEEKKKKDLDVVGQREDDNPKSMKEQVLTSKPDIMLVENQDMHVLVLRAENESKAKRNCETEDQAKEESGLASSNENGGCMEVGNRKKTNSHCHQNQALKRGKVTYVNKRKPHMRLQISRGDRLKQGKSIQSYNPSSVSVLKVRTFTPKSKIMMETPLQAVVFKENSSSVGEPNGTPSKQSQTLLEEDNLMVSSFNSSLMKDNSCSNSPDIALNLTSSEDGQMEMEEVEIKDVSIPISEKDCQIQKKGDFEKNAGHLPYARNLILRCNRSRAITGNSCGNEIYKRRLKHQLGFMQV